MRQKIIRILDFQAIAIASGEKNRLALCNWTLRNVGDLSIAGKGFT
jgi:hypothetical protein